MRLVWHVRMIGIHVVPGGIGRTHRHLMRIKESNSRSEEAAGAALFLRREERWDVHSQPSGHAGVPRLCTVRNPFVFLLCIKTRLLVAGVVCLTQKSMGDVFSTWDCHHH